MTVEVVNGLFALGAAILGALLAVFYQYWQYRGQLKIARDDAIANDKKRVIADLIGYRFVLSERRNDPLPTMHFNVALSSIPVHFSESAECMGLYRTAGDGFNSAKFHSLIVALMKDVPLSHEAIRLGND